MRLIKKVSDNNGGCFRPLWRRAGQGYVEYILVLSFGVLVLVTPFPAGTAPTACANKTQTAIGCLTDSIKGAYGGYNFAVTRPVYVEVDPFFSSSWQCVGNPSAGGCSDLVGQVAGYGRAQAEEYLTNYVESEITNLGQTALTGVWSGFGLLDALPSFP